MASAMRVAEMGAMPIVMVWWMRRMVGASRSGAGTAVRRIARRGDFAWSAIVAKKAGHMKR